MGRSAKTLVHGKATAKVFVMDVIVSPEDNLYSAEYLIYSHNNNLQLFFFVCELLF